MIKKNLMVILLFVLFLVSNIYAQSCYFKTYNSTCDRISTSINTFQIQDISTNNLFDRYEVEIYETKSPDNKLKFQTNNLNINQITPFLEPAVYTIEVKAYDKSNNYKSKKFDYIFDNLEPMPPLIPVILNTTSNSLSFSGKATYGSTLIVTNAQNFELLRRNIVNEDGSFSASLNNLPQGLNYLKFKIQSSNGINSQIVERVVINEDFSINNNPLTTQITLNSLDSLNSNTVLDSSTNTYLTTKRNFYIQGVAHSSPNSIVFINGQRVVTDSNSKFGGFVLLNEGENDIEIVSGNIKINIKVQYSNMRFNFLEVDYNKVVLNNLEVTGKVNFDYPFMLILNGQFVNTINPSSNSFSFSIPNSNLLNGKNFIELRGINSQRYDFIVYKDIQPPSAKIIEEKLSSPNQLIFEIEDDIGINIRDLKLFINSNPLDKVDLSVKGDFYIFDVSSLQTNNVYSYRLEGSDLAGRQFSTSGNFEIDSSITNIVDIYHDEGELIGNKLFINKGQNRINILTSKNIAFKSIYLDEIEQIDYEIFPNNMVKLNLDVEKSDGTLTLEFIDLDRNTYTREYEYYTTDKETLIELDYIKNARTTNYVTLSGKITGEYLDWLSLYFNGEQNFIRYGDNFESIIHLKNSGIQNLDVIISDYNGNSYSKTYGGLLFKDQTKSELNLNPLDNFQNSIKGSIINQEDSIQIGGGNLNFLNSYDGFSFDKLYLSSDNFELPLNQRFGYRTLNVKGYEKSLNRFDAKNIFKNDYPYDLGNVFDSNSIEPVIYFSGNDKFTINQDYSIQGNIKSSSPIKSVTSNFKSCTFDSISFVCEVSNLKIGENIIKVEITDNSNRKVSKDYILTRVSRNLNSNIDSIQGSDTFEIEGGYYLLGDTFDVLGNIAQDSATISILLGGKEILYNQKTGQLNLPVDFSVESKALDKANLNAQIKVQDEYGNVAFSDKIKIYYRRVVESLAKVTFR